MEEPNEELFTLVEAAAYSHVTRQAIYLALKKRGLIAFKRAGKWYIKKEDLDAYRAKKYDRSERKIDGQLVHDWNKGEFSVHDISKMFSLSYLEGGLGRPFPVQHIYYLLRSGQLKSNRKGGTWVIDQKDVIQLLEKERQKDANQMRFA